MAWTGGRALAGAIGARQSRIRDGNAPVRLAEHRPFRLSQGRRSVRSQLLDVGGRDLHLESVGAPAVEQVHGEAAGQMWRPEKMAVEDRQVVELEDAVERGDPGERARAIVTGFERAELHRPIQ